MDHDGCVINTVATDGLVLKHQAISSNSADYIFFELDQFDTYISHLWWTAWEINNTKKNDRCFSVRANPMPKNMVLYKTDPQGPSQYKDDVLPV